jgi:hypothetical protein
MPLNPVGLTSDLVTLFSAPPNTNEAVYTAWANAIRSYTTSIVPAVPTLVQDAARVALEVNFVGMESGAIAVIATALATYTTALAAGMAPPGTPPPSTASLVAALTAAWGTPTTDHVAPATNAATAIDTYFRTGLSAPPTSAPWS